MSHSNATVASVASSPGLQVTSIDLYAKGALLVEDQAGNWVNLITTEACSPEPLESLVY